MRMQISWWLLPLSLTSPLQTIAITKLNDLEPQTPAKVRQSQTSINLSTILNVPNNIIMISRITNPSNIWQPKCVQRFHFSQPAHIYCIATKDKALRFNVP